MSLEFLTTPPTTATPARAATLGPDAAIPSLLVASPTTSASRPTYLLLPGAHRPTARDPLAMVTFLTALGASAALTGLKFWEGGGFNWSALEEGR